MALAEQSTVTLNRDPLISVSAALGSVVAIALKLKSTEIHRGTQADYSPSSNRRYIPKTIRSSCGKARDRE
jgi:hypothetical protein